MNSKEPASSPRESDAEVESASRRGRVSFSGVLVWGSTAGVIYVLSLGPAALAYSKGWLGSGAEAKLEVVYAPLAWLHRHTPLSGPLEWYVTLWMR